MISIPQRFDLNVAQVRHSVERVRYFHSATVRFELRVKARIHRQW